MNFKLVIFGFLAFFSFLNCGNPEAKNNISVEEFKSWIAEGKSIQIIDIRTTEEVEGGIIRGAANIDFYKDNFESELIKFCNKKSPIVVYCQSGKRSSKACSILNKNGFENVYNLLGGYNAWSE